jgi:hypothetical protein
MKTTRKRINKQIILPFYIDLNTTFEGLTSEIKTNLDRIEKEVADQGYETASICLKTDYDGGYDVNIHGIRWETDEELEKRTKTNEKKSIAAKKAAKVKAKKKEEAELELYKKLHKKFAGDPNNPKIIVGIAPDKNTAKYMIQKQYPTITNSWTHLFKHITDARQFRAITHAWELRGFRVDTLISEESDNAQVNGDIDLILNEMMAKGGTHMIIPKGDI